MKSRVCSESLVRVLVDLPHISGVRKPVFVLTYAIVHS